MANALTPLGALRLMIEEVYPSIPYRPYPTVGLLSKQDAYQSLIKWNVNAGGATAGGRATDAASAIAASSDTTVPAQLSIGDRVLGHRFDIIRNDLVQARTAGVGALKSLFNQHIQNGFDVILSGLNDTLYTGTGNAASHGVYGMGYITTAANTYAGINPATYTDFVSVVSANGGTGRNLTRTLLNAMNTSIARKGGSYDLIVTTPELAAKYEELFASEASSSVNVGPQAAIDLGFGAMSYKGRPIVVDVDCTAGAMYFINSRNVQLHTFNLTNSGPDMVSVDAQKTGGLNFLVAQLHNENPHVMSFELSVQPQLKVYNRAKDIAVLADLNE